MEREEQREGEAERLTGGGEQAVGSWGEGQES